MVAVTSEIPFKAYIVATAAGGALETDEALTATATRTLTMPSWVRSGKITRISYMLNPTAAVTYQLAVLEGSNADDNEQQSREVYRSAALLADSTVYNDYSERAFILDTAGTIYYIIDWSGAPGNTVGYIVVEGVAYI